MILSTLNDTILKSWGITTTNVAIQRNSDNSWIPEMEDEDARRRSIFFLKN